MTEFLILKLGGKVQNAKGNFGICYFKKLVGVGILQNAKWTITTIGIVVKEH